MDRLDYNQIMHLNAYLREKEMPYKLIYMNEFQAGIEPLGICACEGKAPLLAAILQEQLGKQWVMEAYMVTLKGNK